MSEQDEVNDLIKLLEKKASLERIPFTCFQIETGHTRLGVPDLFMCIGDKSIWIECKYIKSRDLTIYFQPMQIRTIKRLVQHKQKAIVLVIKEGQYLIVPAWKLDSSRLDYSVKSAPRDLVSRGMDFVQLWNELKKIIGADNATTD